MAASHVRTPLAAAWLTLALAGAAAPSIALAAPQVIPVTVADKPAAVDGNLAEWSKAGWQKVTVKPALDKTERSKYGLLPEDDRNQTGTLTVEVKAVVAGDRFFLAVRYPDKAADTEHRSWSWRGERYFEGREREDMFAVRFHLAGDFDRTMLSDKDYTVDVWLWSAARTNPTGVAEDQSHHMTTRLQDSAAEYALPSGKTVYITKRRDAGEAPYRMLPRPKAKKGDSEPSFQLGTPSGSAADVAAKGVWKGGHWNLEFARAMSTGNKDDTAFAPGQKVLGQIAVFNQGHSEHKSVSDPLLFDFSAVK